MNTLEEFMNRLTDKDSGWWPFSYLKPEKSTPMSNAILIRMSIHYGPFYGALLAILLALTHKRELRLAFFLGNIVFMTVSFFILYRCTFAVFWNRRAHRLQEEFHRGKTSPPEK
jgi:ABC-type uncharacterized transport system permease subunit